ncbi:MAG: helix-turn-helix domain-containing protein [Christensenellales bacterium]
MKTTNAFSHLTLEERRIILTGITNNSTKTAIAQTIGKDKSTVGKEIKLHRVLTHKCKMPLECNNYRKCTFGRNCTLDCPEYSPFRCSRRDRSPGACNGCSHWSRCRFDKFQYCPEDAQMDYRTTLIDSRQGVNLTVQEAKSMASVISPLLKQGHSPYQILANHPELNISRKRSIITLNPVFSANLPGLLRWISDDKLAESFQKESSGLQKRKDNKYLKGRTYRDYKTYISDNPDVFVVQMDTVYNNESNGPFLQTFKFVKTGLPFAIYHEEKTSIAMKTELTCWNPFLGRCYSANMSISY